MNKILVEVDIGDLPPATTGDQQRLRYAGLP